MNFCTSSLHFVIYTIFRERKRSVLLISKLKRWKWHKVFCSQLLISAYKLKNWNELSRILKTEFSVIVAGHVDDKIKLAFWETLLKNPMELEVVEMIENVRWNLPFKRDVTNTSNNFGTSGNYSSFDSFIDCKKNVLSFLESVSSFRP